MLESILTGLSLKKWFGVKVIGVQDSKFSSDTYVSGLELTMFSNSHKAYLRRRSWGIACYQKIFADNLNKAVHPFLASTKPWWVGRDKTPPNVVRRKVSMYIYAINMRFLFPIKGWTEVKVSAAVREYKLGNASRLSNLWIWWMPLKIRSALWSLTNSKLNK